MKKTILKLAFTAGLGVLSLGYINTASAEEWNIDELSNFDDKTMPLEVKELLQKQGQPELLDVNKEDYTPNLHGPSSSKENGDISTFSTTAYVGAYTSDTQNSSKFDEKGLNAIFAEIVNEGIFSGYGYFTFEGYGYTGYLGTGTISSVKSTVSARATGVIPSISAGGTSWSPLSSTRQIATGSLVSGKKYAQANFSNVKIQNISTLTTIFENKSYLNISGVGEETWYEDIWFWF